MVLAGIASPSHPLHPMQIQARNQINQLLGRSSYRYSAGHPTNQTPILGREQPDGSVVELAMFGFFAVIVIWLVWAAVANFKASK